MSLIFLVIPRNRLLIHVKSIEQYPVEIVFKDVYESLIHGISWKEINFHDHNRLFNHLCKFFILLMDGKAHQFKMCHGQHYQGRHFQVIDRLYWYIIRTRWIVRELYPHLLSVQSNFCGPKDFKWRGLIQEDLVILVAQVQFHCQHSGLVSLASTMMFMVQVVDMWSSSILQDLVVDVGLSSILQVLVVVIMRHLLLMSLCNIWL